MKGLVEALVRSRVASNLLMVAVVLGGITSLGSIRHQIFPDMSSDLVEIEIRYPGAGPKEVEKAISMKVEQSLKDLEAIEELDSTASEGVGRTTAKLRRGSWKHEALADIRERIDAIDSFPPHLERPSIRLVLPSQQVLGIAVSGPTEVDLRLLAERLRLELIALLEITKVEILGARRWEMAIEVSEAKLRTHSLSLDAVSNAIRNASIDLPAGRLRLGFEDVQLRGASQALTGAEFRRLPIASYADGSRIYLGEIADIHDGLEERQKWTLLDGRPALMLSVSRVGDQDVLKIADQAHAYIDQARAELPSGVELTVWQDESRFFRSQIGILKKNALLGFLLVALTLALFVHWRLALWVSCGIPLSFLGAFALMPVLGISLNLISLFALILVLGIVVDDAIIVGENVFRLREEGIGSIEASILGTKEVAPAVMLSVSTTIIAFVPMLFIPGSAGPAMAAISSVVILTLIFSLGESLLILPHHLANISGSKPGPPPVRRIREASSAILDRVIAKVYLPTLRIALRWRFLAWALAVALLAISLIPVASGLLRFTFFPPVESENLVATVSLPPGSTAEKTAISLKQLAISAQALVDAPAPGATGDSGRFQHILTTVGHQPYTAQKIFASTGQTVEIAAPHLGEINIAIPPAEERAFRASDLLADWRHQTRDAPIFGQVRFDAALFSAGPAIQLDLSGADLDQLQAASLLLESKLASNPRLFDVTSSIRTGQRELEIRLLPRGRLLGFTSAEVTVQVRNGFQGIEAQRFQRGAEDVRVIVRYPASRRSSLQFLRNMPIRTSSGAQAPLGEIAELDIRAGLSTIRRLDGERVAQIAADTDLGTDAAPIIEHIEASVLPELDSLYPDVAHAWSGGQEYKRQAMGGLERGFLFAILAIYILLAAFCGSYLQPLVIVSAIPFGLIGAFLGHLLLGVDLNIYSLFGIIALSGVIVNDSLVLVDFVNRNTAAGQPLEAALLSAGEQRFRPIILTSLTTFFGLVPLIFERSLQAQFLIPMAISIAFGLLVASVLILFLVPTALAIFHDARPKPKAASDD